MLKKILISLIALTPFVSGAEFNKNVINLYPFSYLSNGINSTTNFLQNSFDIDYLKIRNFKVGYERYLAYNFSIIAEPEYSYQKIEQLGNLDEEKIYQLGLGVNYFLEEQFSKFYISLRSSIGYSSVIYNKSIGDGVYQTVSFLLGYKIDYKYVSSNFSVGAGIIPLSPIASGNQFQNTFFIDANYSIGISF